MKKNKWLITVLASMFCVLLINISSASMHHMNESDGMTQTECSNCLVSGVTNSLSFDLSPLIIPKIIEKKNSINSTQARPPYPPPKI
ncbi:MAG: hypothetical protein VB778_00085 [Nitrospinaceae bacterium]